MGGGGGGDGRELRGDGSWRILIWVIIKFVDPSEGSVNMSIFPPHWRLMAVDFLTTTNSPSVSPENHVIHPPTIKTVTPSPGEVINDDWSLSTCGRGTICHGCFQSVVVVLTPPARITYGKQKVSRAIIAYLSRICLSVHKVFGSFVVITTEMKVELLEHIHAISKGTPGESSLAFAFVNS